MWHDKAIAGTSHRRGLGEQRVGEPPDIVRVLSCILARHAQAAWSQAYDAYAEVGFPLGHGSFSRVGRLRAYGNAICAPLAAEFVSAFLECRP